MPRTAKGRKRPADVIRKADHVMKISTGESTEILTEDGRNKAAVQLGKKGGTARAIKLGARRRKEIARNAAASRWKHHKN